MESFDCRQIRKMHEVLEGYKKNDISLCSLISSLEFLFHALEEVEESWEESFLEEITTLESVASGVPDHVTEETVQKILSEAISSLEKLVITKKEKLLVEILFDPTARVDEKDDAAIDLAEYPSDETVRALVQIGSDKNEDDIVLNSCGESLGQIWVRNDQFPKEFFDKLTQDAKGA